MRACSSSKKRSITRCTTASVLAQAKKASTSRNNAPGDSKNAMKVESIHCLCAAAGFLAFTAGCGEGPIKTVPVYGRITFTDRDAPPTCDLVFQPLMVDGPQPPRSTQPE